MTEAILLLLSLLPALAVVAALHDVATLRIPNWISAALALGFVPAALATGLSWPLIGAAAALGAAGLAVGVGLFALNLLGGGDAKLMAAAVLWLGLGGVGPFVLWTAVAGGAFCLLLLLARPRLQPLAAAAPAWAARLMEPRGDVPYGVAIAIGALAAYPSSDLFRAFVGA